MALGLRCAAWLEPLLTEAERALVDEARARAVAKLERDLDSDPSPAVVRAAGAPSREVARGLFREVAVDLWAA